VISRIANVGVLALTTLVIQVLGLGHFSLVVSIMVSLPRFRWNESIQIVIGNVGIDIRFVLLLNLLAAITKTPQSSVCHHLDLPTVLSVLCGVLLQQMPHSLV
jgi:hypothetical protein